MNLANVLSEIHESANELVVDRIEEEHLEGNLDSGAKEKILPVLVRTCYKPIHGITIFESTSYIEDAVYRCTKEMMLDTFTIPGTSIKSFTGKWYTFKPHPKYIEKAFELLLKNNVIRPVMEFRGETVYVIADDALSDLIHDLHLLSELEFKVLREKWDNFTDPTYEEKERMKVLYSDKIKSDKLFNVIELRRYHFRRFAKKEKPTEFSVLQKNLDLLEEGIIYQIKQIKEKHSETVQNYIFLDDIIKMWCPLFFHDVSAIDEKL